MTDDRKQSPERERGVKEKTKDDIARYDIRYTQYEIRYASVAELADAPGLGPGVH